MIAAYHNYVRDRAAVLMKSPFPPQTFQILLCVVAR